MFGPERGKRKACYPSISLIVKKMRAQRVLLRVRAGERIVK
jgi:hypothetical protein